MYSAIVIGIKPSGLLRAFNISSSRFDSVLSASLARALITTEIINPLKRRAKRITNKELIIEPRSIPKKPLFQTSVTKVIKSSIIILILYP